ncbi:MAG: hypothetical protein L6R39_005104 [Caloplaca ligustica]|nr:MAG: hypothetical protein L6R39_005104 [Caloplaca ligustica]
MHPNPSESTVDENQGIEVLEAGTGHGALTLHLARAVHAANAGSYISEATSGVPASLTGSASIRRQAVIHTIDVSEKYSEHAARIVSSFRRGMYRRDIRFYVGDVSEWIDERLNRPDQQPFLSHALLDLPSTHSVVEKASSALRVDGKLVVFNPSITQINKTIELVKIRRLPLQLDRVVEVGPAMTGGRVWDVRFVKPRALTKRLNEGQAAATGGDDDRVIGTGEELHGNVVVDDDSAKVDEGEEMVCRPKVGDRISGGGFVALWSKNKTRRDGQ